MRCFGFGLCVLTALIMVCVADAAIGGDGYRASGYGGFAWDNTSVYGASACMAPAYGSAAMASYPWRRPNRCDHIWDGYCEEGCGCRGCGHCGTSCGGTTTVDSAGCTNCGPSNVVGPTSQPGPAHAPESVSPLLAPAPRAEARQTKVSTTSAGK